MLFIPFVIFVHAFLECGSAKKLNNACHTFLDYTKARVSKNCFYNPDNVLETPQLIEKYAGKVERHKVTTEDGYILTMFRIPKQNSKGTILLQHALGTNSREWVLQGNASLAFYLWRAGYDIWLNNARGTLFSEKHKNLTTSDLEYWNYSAHEVGYYDVTSQIRLMKSITGNSNIVFIGHSMGTTTGLIYASTHAEEAKNSLKAIILLATSCYFNYTTSPVILLRALEPIAAPLINRLRLGNVMMNLPLLPISRIALRAFPIMLSVINLAMSFGTGWTPDEADPAVINFDAAISIKNYSWKTLLHYLQLVTKRTRFQWYDYGRKQNLKIYNSEEPPLYPLEDISVPILFVSSANDSLNTLEDADTVYKMLSKKSNIHSHLKLSGFNHMDYVVGKHVEQLYFGKILSYINNIFS